MATGPEDQKSPDDVTGNAMTVMPIAAGEAEDTGRDEKKAAAKEPETKIGTMETAQEFLKRRAGSATGDRFAEFLDRVPSAAPEPGDELPRR